MKINIKSGKYNIKNGDIAYTTGAYIVWTGTEWKIMQLEDDTYFSRYLIQNKMIEPYVIVE